MFHGNVQPAHVGTEKDVNRRGVLSLRSCSVSRLGIHMEQLGAKQRTMQNATCEDFNVKCSAVRLKSLISSGSM